MLPWFNQNMPRQTITNIVSCAATSCTLFCYALFMMGVLLIGGCSGQNSTAGDGLDQEFILSRSALPEYEARIDHRGLIEKTMDWDNDHDLRSRATAIYRNSCFGCHGDNEQPGSLPNSNKFWKDEFRHGSDPYSMYQTVTRGYGQMPPHTHLTPVQKYEVLAFIREKLIKPHNPEQYIAMDSAYLASIPEGDTEGPLPQPYHPWEDMDYGNWLIRSFELSDSLDPPKVISKRGSPLPNEDYSQVNFAYKGIAMRLDPGEGGIAAGNTFALFDHDLMRFVGAWTGKGFIDWEDILLDDQHNVYPRTVGRRLMANPVAPGWADPETDSFNDPRMRGADGRKFGPLPTSWAKFKGIYRFQDQAIISYTIGSASVLERYKQLKSGENTVIARTLQVTNISRPLRLRVAPDSISVVLKGRGAVLAKQNGVTTAHIPIGSEANFTLYMSGGNLKDLQAIASVQPDSNLLEQLTHGSESLYPDILHSPIIPGDDQQPYAVDVLVLPQSNPWKSRLRLTGIDFLEGGESAVISTIDGEVWRVDGINQLSGSATWKRIATGMFQPLGIKIHGEDIYVSCRDQIVILRDLNGDGETDFYESFNSDHQVTEHFHEFAMGLQTDEQGNFYYAKSGRHARTSLVPQHGTLIKVSADGQKSEILAKGFRAANGVCVNPDGSFFVTDQQGYWNPMNRINRVTPGGFYGNMWGYGAPKDSSDHLMEKPMMWVDMKYDRSPAELLWAESDQWGPLNGKLLNLSYGYGKIFLIMTEAVEGIHQAGMVELPLPQFPTGIMRARINPNDGQLYACGMAAWATSRMIQLGGLYRVRYTGRPLHLPITMKALKNGIELQFSEALDPNDAIRVDNYQISTWDIHRSSKYGSDRYNVKEMQISRVEIDSDGNTVLLHLPDIQPTRIMEIKYQLKSVDGKSFQGAIQNTINELPPV